MDEESWPQLTRDEEAFICQKPWRKEIGDFAGRLVRERVNAIENTWQKQGEKNNKICYYLEVTQ